MLLGAYIAVRILSATVRENILFSHEYEEGFYNKVVEGALDCFDFLEGAPYRISF